MRSMPAIAPRPQSDADAERELAAAKRAPGDGSLQLEGQVNDPPLRGRAPALGGLVATRGRPLTLQKTEP